MEETISSVLEELFPFIFVVIALISFLTTAAKKAGKKADAHPFGASPVKAKHAAPKQPHPYAPEQPTVAPALSASDVPGQVIVPTVAPALSVGDVPGQVIVPTVHAHVEPDCDTHDAPGSLGKTSKEGKDPCHEEQLTHARTIEEPAPEQGGLTFNWSGDNMMKAVIMQEVLTRPCQRRAR